VFLAFGCIAITGETGMLSYRACTLPSNSHSMAYMLQYHKFKGESYINRMLPFDISAENIPSVNMQLAEFNCLKPSKPQS
jgi:hypothetical protein